MHALALRRACIETPLSLPKYLKDAEGLAMGECIHYLGAYIWTDGCGGEIRHVIEDYYIQTVGVDRFQKFFGRLAAIVARDVGESGEKKQLGTFISGKD